MRIIAIATFAVAAISGAYAGGDASLHRKRTIENKYVTSDVVVEEKEDVYLGLSHRKLEKDSSMSMDIGEYMVL